MKKWAFILFIGFTLLLGACGTENQEASDIYKKAITASNAVENVEMEMVVEQQIGGESISSDTTTNELGAIDPNMPMTTTATAQIQFDPVVMHQTTEVMGMSVEVYYSEDGLFTQGMGKDTWYKIENEEMDLLTEQLETVETQTPAEQLSSLEPYVDDFSYEEQENSYLMKLNASDVDINQLLENQLGGAISEDLFSSEMMDMISINRLEYEIMLDKSTYYPTTIIVDMDMAIKDGEEETTISQKSTISYTSYNELDSFEIPEEVITNAESLQ